MATSAGSDVLPLRKATKARLMALKGDASYDDLLQRLLDAVDESVLRAGPAGAPHAPSRHPEEQLSLADLARTRWSLWRKSGRVTDIGRRMVEYYPPPPSRRKVKLVWPGRRGLPP